MGFLRTAESDVGSEDDLEEKTDTVALHQMIDQGVDITGLRVSGLAFTAKLYAHACGFRSTAHWKMFNEYSVCVIEKAKLGQTFSDHIGL